MWKRLLPFATLLASVTIAIPAFAEVILQEFCRQGGCYQKLLDRPLLRSELQQDPVLKDLMVIRQPNSTNFKVTAEQWQRVFELRG